MRNMLTSYPQSVTWLPQRGSMNHILMTRMIIPLRLSLLLMPVSSRSPQGNELFPWEKQVVPMGGTPPKLPSEQLESATGTS